MVGFSNAISTALGALGIRWTNTDEPTVKMSAERALKNPVVWYAVNKISGHIGQLPLNIHQQTGREIRKPTDHFAYNLMRVTPNAYQTPIVFKRLLTSHALLWGNGYAYIHRSRRRVLELIPLNPGKMAVGLVGGEKVFIYAPNADERVSLFEQLAAGENYITLNNNEVLHIQGLGSDGVCGYSLLSLARESWEAGIAATGRNLSQLRKGHAGGIVLEVPAGQLRNETDAKAFLEMWRRDNDGEHNAGKTAMLREGVTANVLAMSNKDAEFVSTLIHMRQEEALRFMLENILGDDSSVSYNSLEQKNIAYMQNCLNPWLRVWEEECELKLLSQRELSSGYYFKFNDGALLRTDKATSMQTASLAVQNKIWNRNEVREMFDMNPVAGGDEFENPAITPGDGETNPQEPDADSGGGATADATSTAANNSSAAVVLLERLCKIEQQRAGQAAASSKNFCTWIEKFYAKWEPKLADDIERIGGDRDLATVHCNESKRRLLECADALPGDLVKVVEDCVSGWPARASIIVNEMELTNV